MSKKMKVLVSVLVAIFLLTVGGTAVVMAQEDEQPTPPAEASGLLARVAAILGIPEEDLIEAFRAARQEMREEGFDQMLDKAVEEDYITQEEADQIKEWWQQKPEALDRNQLRRALGFAGPHGKLMPGKQTGTGTRCKAAIKAGD